MRDKEPVAQGAKARPASPVGTGGSRTIFVSAGVGAMPRHAFQIIAAALLLALVPGCAGQGGYGFGGGNSSTSIDRIVFSNGSGQANVFIVAPPAPLGGGIPPQGANFIDRNGNVITPLPVVTVNAQGVKGSQSVIVPDAVFTWTAVLNTSDLVDYVSSAGGLQKPCAPATSVTGNLLPDVSPFSATPVIWVQQSTGTYAPLAPQQQSGTVFVSPAPENLVTYETGKLNYCISLTAVGVGGVQATTEIAVASSP